MPLPDYVPTDWVDNVTPVNAARMDNIDTSIDGIVTAHNALETRVAAEEAQPDIPPVENGKWLTGAGGALVWADAPVGGGGSVEYENAWAAATPYTAGDVVIHNGVEYLAVNPSTGATPPAPAAPPAVTPIPLVTALPTPLFDGQEVILVDSLTTPSYAWRLRYVAAAPANKWKFIGGAGKQTVVATSEAMGSSTAWMDPATVGPSFVIPRAGAYSVRISAAFADSGGAQQKYVRVGAGVGAFTTMLVQASGWFSAVAGLVVSPSVEQELSFAAGDEIRVRYIKEWTTAVDVSARVLTVTPVALS